MTTDKIEVLAPAGNPAALKAAVFAGADAVYMGGALFSARANAANFSREEMREAAAFARERGVRVYVTVNTLVKDAELAEALDFCAYLCSLPVDGILVQDMGLFALLHEACPEMPLHASTQMSLHTPGGAALLQSLGASRVVLAREMSLEEIRAVSAQTDVELEAFVHGALCMSLSGQCYFSAMLGGRSGNRGRCAQTCRLPFAAPGGTGHDLSLKDMSFIEHIGALSAAGVCSAKIEGRMKRPEYVAAAVSACRHAADGEPVPPALLEDLGAVFSRSGFTDGYLSAQRGRSMFGIRTKEDVEGASSAVFASLHALYKNERQCVPVTFRARIFEGEHPALTVSDGAHTASVADEAHVCAAAQRLPVDTARWQAQLQKTGGTPYRCTAAEIETDGRTAVPVSVLNGLRRAARRVPRRGADPGKRRRARSGPAAARHADRNARRAAPVRARADPRDPAGDLGRRGAGPGAHGSAPARGLHALLVREPRRRRAVQGTGGVRARRILPQCFQHAEPALLRVARPVRHRAFDGADRRGDRGARRRAAAGRARLRAAAADAHAQLPAGEFEKGLPALRAPAFDPRPARRGISRALHKICGKTRLFGSFQQRPADNNGQRSRGKRRGFWRFKVFCGKSCGNRGNPAAHNSTGKAAFRLHSGPFYTRCAVIVENSVERVKNFFSAGEKYA